MTDSGLSRHARDQPEISVVIAVRNGEQTLDAQLDALAAQTFSGSWEIIIADNGSTDGTRSVAQGHQGRIPWLRIEDVSERSGDAAARNLGTARARAPIVAYCDADDVVDPGWLQAIAEAMMCHDMVVGSLDFSLLNPEGGKPQPVERIQPRGSHRFLPFGVSANMAVSKEVFGSLGGFDERFRAASDVELSWSLQLAGHRFHYEAGALVHKRRRQITREVWAQHVVFGLSDALLYRSFRSRGMRARPLSTIRTYAWLVATLPRLGDAGRRSRWVRIAGRCWGRVRGSWRHRVLYL